MSDDLVLAVIQADIHWQNPKANRDMYELYIRAQHAADVIILPEASMSSFSPENPEIAEPMDGPSVQWLQSLAKETQTLIGAGLCINEAGKLYNRFVWAFPDGQVNHYDKRHLFTFAGEDKRYQRGEQPPLVIEYKNWRIRCAICYELRFPAWLRNQQGQDYDLLVVTANWPGSRDYAWRCLNRARAIENVSYLACCNRVGTDGRGDYYNGGSAIYDYQGHALSESQPKQAEVIRATLKKSQLHTYRKHFPVLDDRDEYHISPSR